MKDFLDFFVIVAFVIFMIYIMRGFILQVQENEEKKKKR